ncbi:sarcosine oxidase subunit gamma [Thioalkalivibrio sp. HK1]|uniref:sarcosine oxidase subunit gamma n=1 Tax=Thioalkalivibrio sp. HK1 TaxID=1469245 RepID=UPI000470DEE8|nr:sarcosine oxidase subunit gamma family protein [Thioalkalivibrio sp. HK1]
MKRSARTSALEGCIVGGRLAAGRRDDLQVASLDEPDIEPSLIIAPEPPCDVVRIGGIEDIDPLAESFGVEAAALRPGRWVLAQESAEGEVTLAWAGPGQWLVMSDAISAAVLIDRASKALEPSKASTVDLSCARTPIRLSGSAAPELLAGLCPIDIESSRTGDSLFTSAGGIDVHLMVMGRQAFRIGVPRSLAQAMWEMLLRCSREFEVEIGSSF